ncbi:MAG TPA: class I SAM-dependent methyltransferase [Acidimicrobiales bacterium]|nr:class I SAM-dependent methyltransferase [Acidimicrobiales bacterium]
MTDASPPAPHQARGAAESFGADAARYDRTRPHYPQALVDRIVAASPGPDVLDVGVGTGISARPFLRAGCTVLGIDVDARMAEFARETGITVEVARFEDWDPAGRSFDAVVAGQTWHWVDPVVGARRAAAVLRPGGRLALFWNVFVPPPELSHAMAEVYRRELPDTPFSMNRVLPGVEPYGAILDATADGIRSAGAFDEPERWRFDWERPYTRHEWLEQVPTFGGHNRFPPEVLGRLLEGIGAAVDAVGGRFVMGYSAVVVTAARAPVPAPDTTAP